MEKKRTMVFAVLVALAIATAFIFFGDRNLTGFFSLQNNAMDANGSADNERVSAEMSIQIIKQTELEISAPKSETMRCPQYVSIVFEARNAGNSAAEGFAARPSKNLKVLDCTNCRAKKILPMEKLTVRIKACKENAEKAFVSFSSINSGEKRIGI